MKFYTSKGLLGSFFTPPRTLLLFMTSRFSYFYRRILIFLFISLENNFWAICILKNQKASRKSSFEKKQVGNGGSVLLNWTGFDCSHVKTDPSYSISDLQKRFWSFSKDFLGLRTWKYCFLPGLTHTLA